MSEPLFEQYKAALRRGHLATISGELDEALDAYGEAARLVPERPLPFASRGTVLHRLDRWPDAAEAFDQALRVSPDDEATLRSRAVAREERGMLSGAAEDFERLAFVLDVAGRGDEAIEAARKAVDIEPTPARSELVARLSDAEARSVRRNGSAWTELEPLESDEAATSTTSTEAPADDDLTLAAVEAVAAATDEPPPEGANWPAIDLPTPPPPPMDGPPPDPEALLHEAAELLESGDVAGASERMLTAVLVHRAAGRLDAALDICLQLLSIAPGDPHVHLALTNLQLDYGWTGLAKEKIELLLRLTGLTGDTQAEADVHGLAAERLRDEPAPVAARR